MDYYSRNREVIIERAKENYKKKKERNPEFWKKEKSLPMITEDELKRDEEQMYRIMKYIKDQREADEKKKCPEKKQDFKCYLAY